MIQTVVTPQRTNLDLSVLLPDTYVGKLVHVLFYTDYEAKNKQASISPIKKPSDFAGTLSKETADELLKHIEQSRNEWERNI